jgi:hypothetical protein
MNNGLESTSNRKSDCNSAVHALGHSPKGIIMRKVLTIAISAVAAAALSGTPAAHASSDSKVPLIYGPLVECAAVADPIITGSSTETESYVKLKHDDDGGVRVELGLRDAVPGTTFDVRVVQVVTDATTSTATAMDCNTVDGQVITDDRGRAKIRLTEDRAKDADSFQVFAYPHVPAYPSDSKEAPSGYHTSLIPLDSE